MEKSKYTYRILARLVIEAKTPLAVGSGDKNIFTDALVAKDVNGLPYIPGTAIAGVVRHMIGVSQAELFFGKQDTKNPDRSKGSEIIFSDAKILNSEGKVMDGLSNDVFSDSLLSEYSKLPIRQHVRINSKGVTADKGKFDEQVCFAGSRFCFEIELVAENEQLDNFNLALSKIFDKSFRIGSGTRCGFGEIEVVDLKTKTINLAKDLDLYLKKSSNLDSDWEGWSNDSRDEGKAKDFTEFKVNIKAKDFFIFGSGFGDSEVDATPVRESKIVWQNGKGKLVNNVILLPATSIKGAIAHRVAFHFNRLNRIFLDGNTLNMIKGAVNPAVMALFGYENQEKKIQKRGNLLFSDIIEEKYVADENKNVNTQVHVAIDRFTGGAKTKSGALFSEKNVYGKDMSFEIRILKDDVNLNKAIKYIYKEGLSDEIKKFLKSEENFSKNVNQALSLALNDLKNGMMPLGGGVCKGHGIFVEA